MAPKKKKTIIKKKVHKRRTLPSKPPKGTHSWINPTNHFFIAIFPDQDKTLSSKDPEKLEKRISDYIRSQTDDVDRAEGILEDFAVYKVYEEQALDLEIENVPEVHINE